MSVATAATAFPGSERLISQPIGNGPPVAYRANLQRKKAPPGDGAKLISGSWDRGYKLAPRTHVRRPTRPKWGGGVSFLQHCLKNAVLGFAQAVRGRRRHQPRFHCAAPSFAASQIASAIASASANGSHALMNSRSRHICSVMPSGSE